MRFENMGTLVTRQYFFVLRFILISLYFKYLHATRVVSSESFTFAIFEMFKLTHQQLFKIL